MGIFNSIKKSRRASSDIDEKIEYLNKELEKTGLREAMTTSNIYVGGQSVDNPIYTSFKNATFNGLSLGHSGADGVGSGGAYTGTMVPSEVGLTPGYHDSILNTKGAALSPPHPVSGKRRYATTRLGGMIGQQYFPTRPGVIQGNRTLPTGSVAWLWNPNINNTDDTTGNWYPLEFEPHNGRWGFWDTNFMGFGYLNLNLDQLEFTSGDNTGATVLSLFNSIGIRNTNNIGTEKTIVLQKNDLGDVGFLPIDVGLSKQGYDYLSGKARKGARSLRGGTVYRKAGSGGGRRTTTTRDASLIPYGRGGKVSSRGVGNYIRSKGAGFSPSANRVAQNVAKELPPEPTPAEIRNETVNQFRENGDNYAANKFYTEDRISELESKPELTSTEQKELDQLKVNAVHINQNPPPPKPEQIETNIESINTSLANGDIGAFANAVATASIPSTIETAFDTNNETHRALSEMSPDQLEKALESLEFKTPNPVSVMWKSLIQHYAEGGGVLDAETRTGFGNKLAIAKAVLTGEDVNVTSGDIADSEKENYVSSLRPEDFGTNIQINNGVAGYVDDNIIENPDGTTRPNTEGAESVTNDFNYGSSIGNFGQNHTQFVVPDGVTLEMLKNGEGWDKTRVSTRDYAYANTDKLKDPAARAEEFGPYAKFFEAAQFLGNLNPFNKGTEGKPDNVSAAAKTTFEQSGDTLSDEQKAAIIASMEKNGVNNIENPLDDKVANPPSRVEKQQDKDYEKNRRRNRYSNPKENNADKYPPPKQESIFTDEDGNKTKFYTRKIFTGKDGKTYKEVLRMPWIQPKGGGNGYFAGLHSPSSYIFSFSLFDTPMDKPLGDYTPPDDLPDIPYTPEPEPKPKPQGGYGGGQGNPTNRRGSGARSEDTLYQSKGKLLSEAAKLGHFEPEILNVDINDLRKGIMPEFPKDPPPKMVDGYSEKSKLAPKTIEGEPFIKITKKDLAKNHMLKDSEIKKFMDEIDSINKYIKENPSELIYAQQRYPKDDPRLAQLNWQMDQMLDASKEYMDRHYPENKKLFKKVQKAIGKNIELTDPKSFKGVEIPKFEGVDLTDYKRRKEVVSRHFKKAVKIQKLFSNKKRRNNIKEQIEYKDNNLHEFMTTTGMYFSGQSLPNQDYSAFQALNHNGFGLALSGADGNSINGASVEDHLGANGVALSPPHPVTGVRTQAVHVRDGLGGTTPLRPGAVIKRGFADNAPDYTMGSAMWFYFPTHDNGVGVPPGKWCNFEYGNFENNSGWGFWDTIKTGQFAGLWIFNRTTSQHPCGDIDLATKIASINFGENGTVGAPQTIVLNKNDLGDPDLLPINIKDLAAQAFNYLKDKAQQALGFDGDDNLATKIEKAKDAFINFIGMTNPIAKLLTSIPVFDYASEILTSLILNEPIYKGNDDVSMEDKQNYIKGIPPGFFLDSADTIPRFNEEQPYSDDNIYKDPNTNQVVAHTEESKKQFPDNTSTFSQTNLGALPIKGGDGTSFGNTVNLDPFMITNKISARGNMQNQIIEPEDGSEVYLKVHDFAYLNEDKINDSGELPSWLQQGIAKPLINLIDKFHNRKSGSENTGAMSGFSSNIHGASELEFKIPFSQWTKEQKEAYNKSKNKSVSESLSEAVKLGHFDPEVLNVDINDIRKGIMPEFPKDPPPEMINGYAANSRLAPKKIDRDPFIKITKKDLAQNHKLTDKEISDFMNDIKMVNEYIKKNPADLIYAQTRYPKDDPRLAQLNWQMDQKLNASKEYMDKHYPENQKLFTKIQKSIKKNIELTDPKSFKDVKVPKFEGVDLTDYKRRKAFVSRHFKKAIRKIKKKT